MMKALWGVVAALVLSASPALHAETLERVMTMNPPRPVADFELTDQKGTRKRLSSLAGQPTFVFFGFTHCPEICPTTMQKLAQLKSSQSSELAKLQVVLISVDGERDTPEAMAEFLKQFPKDFIGLTGPSAEVREIALRFSAPFFKNPPKDGTYLVEHSSRVYALDKQGHLRAELYDAPNDSMLGLARALLAE
jgi:cytochrome oxidase Cu insertion factor (SCO1/SenC/PrrC family)